MRRFRSSLALVLAATLGAGAAPAEADPATDTPPAKSSVVPDDRGAAADRAPEKAAAAERLHASTSVPDEKRRVGTVRLLSRNGAVVVETLLETRLLSRAVAEIRAKEKRSWGEDDASSRAYMEALEGALARVLATAAGDDGKRRLFVEIVASDAVSRVSVGTFAAFDAASAAPPQGREAFATLDLPREWVLREIRLVVADSFDVPEGEADRIGPLRPAVAAP